MRALKQSPLLYEVEVRLSISALLCLYLRVFLCFIGSVKHFIMPLLFHLLTSSDSLLTSCRVFCLFEVAAEVVRETNRFLFETSQWEPTRLCYALYLSNFQQSCMLSQITHGSHIMAVLSSQKKSELAWLLFTTALSDMYKRR